MATRANHQERLGRTPPVRVEPPALLPGRLWAVVLAGGEGVRLRPLTRSLYGEDRPKQYATLVGSRSLLRHTLDRVALAILSERTVVVTLQAHAGYAGAEFDGAALPRVLVQPEDRGTAAGILFPAHWISWEDPDATVLVLPSDHFIVEEAAFMAHVMALAAFVEQHPEWLVLVGAQPTTPETEYGWIERGAMLAGTAAGPLFTVRRFWEKPSGAIARVCFATGCFWNTLVFVGKARTLIQAGVRFLPELSYRLARIARFRGTEDEAWATRQAYALAPKANFSRAVLEACPALFAVSRLPAITWSDWGTPERVVASLRAARLSPPWLDALGHPA